MWHAIGCTCVCACWSSLYSWIVATRKSFGCFLYGTWTCYKYVVLCQAVVHGIQQILYILVNTHVLIQYHSAPSECPHNVNPPLSLGIPTPRVWTVFAHIVCGLWSNYPYDNLHSIHGWLITSLHAVYELRTYVPCDNHCPTNRMSTGVILIVGQSDHQLRVEQLTVIGHWAN